MVKNKKTPKTITFDLKEYLEKNFSEIKNRIDKIENKVDRLSENHMKHLQQSINWLIGIGVTISLAVVGILVKLMLSS